MIKVRKSENGLSNMQPLVWTTVKAGDSSRDVILVSCTCGLWLRMDDRWTVDKNGVVSPSLMHQSCGFHEFITLEDWGNNHA